MNIKNSKYTYNIYSLFCKVIMCIYTLSLDIIGYKMKLKYSFFLCNIYHLIIKFSHV